MEYGYGMPMRGYGMGYGDERYYPIGCSQEPVTFRSNGEKIYFTGINDNGERVSLNWWSTVVDKPWR